MTQPYLKYLPLTQIETGKRYRTDYGDDFESFKLNIKEKGILQPIAVIEKDGKFTLGAGGRRLKAATELSFEVVPCQIFPDAGDVTLREIELYENIHRKDLSWQEEVKLTEELHSLQESIYGKKVSRNAEGEGWNQQKTADMIGKSRGLVTQDLELASVLKEAPALFKDCKTKTDAKKTLQKVKTEILNEALANKATTSIKTGDDAEKKRLLSSYQIGNVLEQIPKIADNSIDLVEMDPPYNLDLTFAIKNLTEAQAKDLMSPNFTSPEEYVAFIKKVLEECYRVLKPGGWLVLWHPSEFKREGEAISNILWKILNHIGFNVRPIRACWVKINSPGVTRSPDSVLGSNYEQFFYASKGTGVIKKQGRANCFYYQPIIGHSKDHPTERPIEMIQEVIETFASSGSTILVPFLGSGNTILAANNALMKASGWDICPDYLPSYIKKVNDKVTRSVVK